MAEKKTVSVKVYDQTGAEVSKMSLKIGIFGVEANNQVMFDAVQVYRSNCRQATAKTKVRHEVSGGGKKPWRQKGTGRARAGSSRSPIWVGGGTVFGPDGTQNYKLSQNKAQHNLALRSALSLKTKNGLVVLDKLALENGKTKELINVLAALKVTGKTLLVTEEVNEAVVKAAGNLQNVKVVLTNNVSVYDLLNADNLVITKQAVKNLEEALG